MDNQKFIRIVSGQKYLDMSLDIIAKYPNSPFYSYFKEYSIKDISFTDLCMNQNFQLDFDSFVTMYNVISGERDYIDAPEHIKNIIDKFGLIDPTLNRIGGILENDMEKSYAVILRATKQLYEKFSNFLSNKNTLFIASFDEYQKYKDILSTNQNIIPVQIILNRIYFPKRRWLTTIIQSINIYNSLPLYHISATDNKPDIFFLEDENMPSGININAARKKILALIPRYRVRLDLPYIYEPSYASIIETDDQSDDIIKTHMQYFYDDDMRGYIEAYIDLMDQGFDPSDITDDVHDNYINKSKIIDVSHMIDRKQTFRNIYTTVTQSTEMLQKLHSARTKKSQIIFGFVHV